MFLINFQKTKNIFIKTFDRIKYFIFYLFDGQKNQVSNIY